jgi:hypothetical protein
MKKISILWVILTAIACQNPSVEKIRYSCSNHSIAPEFQRNYELELTKEQTYIKVTGANNQVKDTSFSFAEKDFQHLQEEVKHVFKEYDVISADCDGCSTYNITLEHGGKSVHSVTWNNNPSSNMARAQEAIKKAVPILENFIKQAFPMSDTVVSAQKGDILVDTTKIIQKDTIHK